jgi:hypothetical protein
MTPTTRSTLARFLACAAVPLVASLATAAAYREVAPLWAGGSTDPSYEYLLNSLMAAELRLPVKTDHPGITVEVLGAIALRLRHAVSASALPLRDHVLTDPERFLAATVVVFILVFAASSVFLGWAAWRLTGSVWLAALAQASPFLCFEVFRSLVQVMCEPLLLAAANTLSALLLLSLRPGGEETTPRLALGMGAVVGLGLATKLVFLPAAIPPLVAARSSRARVQILLGAAIAFGACLLLIAPRLPATAAWMWRLFAHSGYHGAGEATVVDLSRYPAGIARLLRSEVPLHAAYVASLLVCLWPGSPRGLSASARRCALGVFAAWALTLAAAAKQPQAHYLVTAAGLLPSLLVLAFWRLQLEQRRPATAAVRAALTVMLAVGAVHASRKASWLIAVRAEAKTGATLVAEAAAREQRTPVLGHRVSTIPGALAAGNEWAGLAYSADLRRLYPGVVSFDCEGLHAFGQDIGTREARLQIDDEGMALLQDAAWRRLETCPWSAAIPRTTLASGGRDALYKARLLPPPRGADAGPWIGGLLVIAGLEESGGAHRCAIGPRTSLVLEHGGGPASLEVAAGHVLPGAQGLAILFNGRRVDRRTLPRLPATDRFTVPLDLQAGWNEIDIVYDAVAAAPPRVESALLGFRARARSPMTPGVCFETLHVVAGGPS